MITDLPINIIDLICADLANSDICNLKKTCKTLNYKARIKVGFFTLEPPVNLDIDYLLKVPGYNHLEILNLEFSGKANILKCNYIKMLRLSSNDDTLVDIELNIQQCDVLQCLDTRLSLINNYTNNDSIINIKKLYLFDVEFIFGFKNIRNLEVLTVININNTQVLDLCNATHLRDLLSLGCKIKNLHKCINLRSLVIKIKNNKKIKKIAGLVNLTILNIAGSPVNIIPELPLLKMLNISNTNVTHLPYFKHLTNLDISDTNFTNTDIINSFTNLKTLIIINNKININAIKNKKIKIIT